MKRWKQASLALLVGLSLVAGSGEARTPYSTMAIAIRRGNMPEVVRLLDTGTPVNERSGKYQETPLMVAARRGTLEMVKLLVARGADVNASSPTIGTALHAAAFRGRLDLCRVLIEHKADVNAPNDEGWTVLHQVVNGAPDYPRLKGEYLEVVKLLVEKGADVGARTRGGLTALDMLKTRSAGERQKIADFLRLHSRAAR